MILIMRAEEIKPASLESITEIFFITSQLISQKHCDPRTTPIKKTQKEKAEKKTEIPETD